MKDVKGGDKLQHKQSHAKPGKKKGNKSPHPQSQRETHSEHSDASTDASEQPGPQEKPCSGTPSSLDSKPPKSVGEKCKEKGAKTKTAAKHVSTDNLLAKGYLKLHSTDAIWWATFLFLTALAFATRLYNVSEPPHVCWDETHFGKMGSWYINRTFFFDVHPPLGKMLVGLSGYLTGYDGSFPFKKPGDQYGETHYIGMRVFCATLGSLLVPLSFGISWELAHSLTASTLTAVLILCDTGILTLTRYILLDPYLLFFIVAATYCMVKFQAQKHRAFTGVWWFWLSMVGVFLSCSMGVKFVGLFVILFAGYTTVVELWVLMGNLAISMVSVVKHFLARALCLILLPALLYLLFFAIHFHVLNKSGSGDSFFSSSFQSQLQGNPLYNANMPEDVAYGSVVTIKNHRTGGAYLHSHWHLYPEGVGVRQQQVTSYGHKDENNKWLIKRFDKDLAEGEEEKEVEYIKNGALVRLEHVATTRNLHSHAVPGPVSTRHFQATCYGINGTGDSNDVFRVDIVGARAQDPLKTVRSVFKLVHVNLGCALYSHGKQLPKWGFDQFEVTCNPNTRDYKGRWNIEEVFDKRLPNTSFEVYAPSFLQKFMESHAVMFQGNSGLKPKEGEVTSLPWQWPINYRGQPFSGLNHRVYLLGNPVIWWLNLAILALFTLMYAWSAVRKQRGYVDDPEAQAHRDVVFSGCGWLLLGWALHYVPFWGMGRVLYFHHYFPALMYNFIISGLILEYMMTSLSRLVGARASMVVYHTLFGAFLSIIVYSFYLFHPLSYGMSDAVADNKTSSMHGLKWLDTWEI